MRTVLVHRGIMATHAPAGHLRALIEAGADLEACDEDDMHAPNMSLIIATRAGLPDLVRERLASGCCVNTDDGYGFTPLHVACEECDAECVQILIDARADVNAVEWEMLSTPLMLACGHMGQGSLACAQVLLEAHAKTRVSISKMSAMTCAATTRLELVKVFYAYGHTSFGFEPFDNGLELAEDVEDFVNFSSNEYVSRLHYFDLLPAHVVKRLLADGADLNARADCAKLYGGESDEELESCPSPLDLAREASGQTALAQECARLICRAAEPWSPENHELFPKNARRYAVQLFLIGVQFERKQGEHSESSAMLELWVTQVMPNAVTRTSCYEPRARYALRSLDGARSTIC